ncbi:MAG: hypothetical protein J6I68_15025 [Butyrivibrio sp.]|uniref:hypothetical protein n=1 Tax=Butyrivibrio sp. TaxID=28121 RepID=UPI001B798146|nr:hypothetical protein [Butyrivibrio sp.]MBP3784556.1 hypothetical protein [Butyrivibrio sp.]
MKKIISTIISTALLVTTLTACGEPTNTAGAITGDKKSYTSSLEDGVYYVRDKDNNCTPVYFGNGTFEEGSISTTPADDRVLWYKDDFEKIPTLYKGDSLIMFTKSEIEERMVFERFELYNATIGICGMEELKSGRYKIFTDSEKKCTYPYGDTDDILKLDNSSVILESIGGQDIRKAEQNDETKTFLTRSGTILGLVKGESYNVDIYEGTILHKYVFTADVIPLGSMETVETYDYKFEEENLINITIPEFFNTGYYMINGAGLFRYVNGTSYDNATVFNTPNEVPEGEETTYASVNQQQVTEYNDMTLNSMEEAEGESPRTFNIKQAGRVNVNVSFTIPGNYGEGDGLDDVAAIIEMPSGGKMYMIKDADGSLSRSFYAEVGTYTITFYNLGIREPKITFE